MEIEQFNSGRFQKGGGYTYFLPNKVNEQWTWQDPTLNDLLEKASAKLGELNAYARWVPNIDLFIQLHVATEAVISSRIEGTQTNIEEAIMPEEDVLPERRGDWQEVQNYILAMNRAIAELEDLPLSSRLLRMAHRLLLDSVRGEDKMPGEFRASQNWIGGRAITDAVFIPPHKDYISELMGDLENFLHNENIKVPRLIRIAIAHYQFETIHPFLDGNGRIGRLMITLYLVSEKMLDQPLLYLSTFFERDKQLYYDKLMRVRTQHEMMNWLKYFLIGIENTASRAVETLAQIMRLKERVEGEVYQNFGRRASSAFALLQYLFQKPLITVEEAKNVCELSFKAANDLVAQMVEQGYLVELTGQSRNRLFAFEEYLRVFR